jgi:serine/threonine-protein phosphatase 2A activator
MPETLQGQLLPLLLQSHAFGHPTRIDYGTGHELAFALALWCCVASGWISGKDEDELVLRVFPRYLDLATKLQVTYRLEPAGSHGVWGLDDYCFLPYLFGSAQLFGGDVSPSDALRNATSTKGPFTDLYTLSLHRISLFKRGAGFREHSPLLHSLSEFPNWVKPHGGLLKMFQAEVLGKRVVVQGLFIGGWCWGDHMPAAEPRQDASAAMAQTTVPPTAVPTTAAPWAAAAGTRGVGTIPQR